MVIGIGFITGIPRILQ